MFTSPRVLKYFFSSCNLEIPFLVVLLLFLRRKFAHNRGTCWFFRNPPARRVDWICLKHFLISSLCVLFLSNVTWPPQQRFNCGNLGPLQTWAFLNVPLKSSQLSIFQMKNWKHIESDLVHYWFGDHFSFLFSPFFVREDWNFNCSTMVFNS